MKSSFLELIRSAFGPKDEKFRQRISIFSICLVISVIIWFSIKLANSYDTVIELPVSFINPPKNKVLTGISDSVLRVEIVDKGSDLFRLEYLQKNRQATINLKNVFLYNKGGRYESIVTPSAHLNEIEQELNLMGKILAISPDTLYLTFENQKSKKVPVGANFILSFKKQFMQYGNVFFEPDSVTVKGPANLIDQLDSANLGNIVLENLHSDVEFERRFSSDSINRLLDYSPVVVKVKIPVEKYTESEMESQLEIINCGSHNIKIFPDKVKVIYKVALKDFDRIEPGMITVTADFSDVDLIHDNSVRLRIGHAPDFVVITKTVPEKAEFIIVK